MSVRLSVVIPVFNEEESVVPLHAELSEALTGFRGGYEIVFVDDGSRDATVERLRELAAMDPHLIVIRLARNQGQSAALQAGFDLVSGDAVVTLDGDLQNDPADIPRLVEELDRGFDVVCGWRRQRQDRLVSRRLPSVAANWLIGRVTGVRIHDNGCTLRAYRRAVVEHVQLYSEMHRFLTPLMALSGSRISEIVVNHRSRQFGESKYGLSRVWKVLLDLLTIKTILRFASHPSVVFCLLGAPLLLAGLGSAALSTYLYIALPGGEVDIVVPSVTFLLFFASFHLLVLGMLAELVAHHGEYREAQPILAHLETKPETARP